MKADKSFPSRPGGRIIADALLAQGVTIGFTVPGESFLDTLDGLYAVQDQFRLITCRFEAGAGHMAEAVGKLTGRPAAAFVTRGPGASHAAIAVHVAAQDSTPLLLFIGQIPHGETDRDSFQEIDYRRMFGGIAKWVTQIDDAARIPELIAHAVDVATSGRPGPVVIALSEEMQAETASVPDLPPARRSLAFPDPAAIDELIDRLGKAARPLVIMGGSGWRKSSLEDLQQWLRRAGLPVTAGFRRQGLYPGAWENYAGDLGVGSDPALVAAAQECDLVLAIGTRLGEAVSQGYTLFDLAGATPIIQIHPESAELGRVHRLALGVTADLNAFADTLTKCEPPLASWQDWTQHLRRLRDAARAIPDYPSPLNLAQALQQLEHTLPADAIFTTDAGNFATWPTRFMNLKPGQDFLGPVNGAMGYAVPAAIGASLHQPHRQVVAFVGDGGFLMTGSELATALQYDAKPIILLFNNGMYGTIRMYQERRFPGRPSGTALRNPDFVTLAQAYGAFAARVSRTEEFAPALKAALNSGKAAVIELVTDPRQITSRLRLEQKPT